MTHHQRCLFRLTLPASLMLFLCASLQLHAQFPGGGFGGFGGGGGNNTRSRSSTTRSYPNNGVGDAVISIDPETRNLIVIADDDTSRYVSEVVSNLNRPKPQVLIKVVFIEVTHSDSLDLGIEGNYNKNIGNPLVSGFTTNFTVFNGGASNASIVPSSITPINQSLALANNFGLNNSTAGGLYQLFAQDYQVTLHAIAQAGKAKVLSRPSIVARNNQPATILVGQTVPLITSVRYDTLGNAINGITYTDVGIILRVTPFINNNGMIEMILSPEISSVSKTDSTPLSSGINSVNAPFIDKRSADTVVVTPDGQTVIIGGLMANAKSETESKIPFLGDIPYLGNLFKHKIKSDSKTELLIFLTPHVIAGPTEMAALTDREREKSPAAKGLTEQELNHFLDNLPALPTNPPPASSSSPHKVN